MNIEWLAAWPQVGDASEYLSQGEDCAYEGQCFNTLRPIISMLWFSLPHRLGLPSTAILILHALLLLCSIALAVHLLIRPTGKSGRFSRPQQVLAVVFSASIHAVFIWPTFFYSLTDTPAALLILCAIFLLLILQSSNAKFRGIGYFFIGLLLGCAEGLRIFYLYPLLAFLALYLTISVLQKQREWRKFYLISALLPVLLQNYATFLYSGEIAHLPTSSEMRFWSNVHRSSTYTGYDTLIPEQGYPWFTSHCAVQRGILPSWQKNDWQQLSCLIAGRVYFLLGSYGSQTYFERNDIDFSDVRIPETLIIKEKKDWKDPYSNDGWIVNLYSASDDAITTFVDLPEKSVTFALSARSDAVSSQLKLGIMTIDRVILIEKLIPMTTQPTRHFLHAEIPAAGKYIVTIGPDKIHPVPFIFEIGDFRLTASNAEEAYPAAPNKVRYWSPVILCAQTVIVVLFIITILKKSKNQPELLAIAAFPLLIIAQALIVIPEQRFIIVSEICFWLVAAAVFMRHQIKQWLQTAS